MSSHLHDRIVLVLNRHWTAIDAITSAEAFSHLCAGTARALEILPGESIQPLDWETWRALPVADGDRAIGTTQGRVRVPTVILLNRFDQMPLHIPSFGLRGIWQRDGGRCQYTGRALEPGEGDIDHIVPRSRGGPTSWENCVLSDRRVNRSKGARTPTEAGLRLLRPPGPPRPRPAIALLHNLHQIADWNLFLPRENEEASA